MIIKIKDSFSPDVIKEVSFSRLQSSRRRTYNYIEARPDSEYGEPACINIPATGDIRLEDIPEFIKAIKLAAMIASGELEID